MTGTTVAGADGARRGWACAVVRAGDERAYDVTWSTAATMSDVVALPAKAVGVDMPVGLPASGRRQCDRLAKAWLGRAHPRVFLTPPRAVLETGSQPEASALHRTLVDGAGLSIQTWHLLPKVVEVDAVAGDPRLVEVHPELSFAALAGTVLPPKRTAGGRAARVAALRDWTPGLTDADVPRGDDHLDALAVAWSAWRWLRGAAEVLPPDPPQDARGRPMRIVV